MADKISTRSAYGDALVELGKKDPNIIVMDADLSKSTMTAGFKKEFPERFFNAGIAEANLMGMAARTLRKDSFCQHICNVRSRQSL